jgi:hypothetical protein
MNRLCGFPSEVALSTARENTPKLLGDAGK